MKFFKGVEKPVHRENIGEGRGLANFFLTEGVTRCLGEGSGKNFIEQGGLIL